MAITKAHCNTCSGETNHVVLHNEQTRWRDDLNSMSGGDSWDMLKCQGCDGFRFRHVSWDTESEGERITYFPPARSRPEPNWMIRLWLTLPAEEAFVEDLLSEIYSAYFNGLLHLATMGVRSLIERMMVAKISDKGSFGKNLSEFERLGYVSNLQRIRLGAILEAGHAAIHRDYKPSEEDLNTLLDITEHVVASVYLHGDQVAALRQNVPRRTPRVG